MDKEKPSAAAGARPSWQYRGGDEYKSPSLSSPSSGSRGSSSTFCSSASTAAEASYLAQKTSAPVKIAEGEKKPRSTLYVRKKLPSVTGSSIGHPHADAMLSDPAFLALFTASESSNLAQKTSAPNKAAPQKDIKTKLLSSFEEHKAHLIDSIGKARKSILITSHSFSATLNSHRTLFDALRKASLRRVSVYLYFNKDHALGKDEIDFLEQTGIRLNNPPIHSKLLVVDKNLVACGSFDWLSNPNYLQGDKNASVVLEGKDIDFFTEELWDTLKKYNRLAYKPDAAFKIDRKFDKQSSAVLAEDQGDDEYELLTTPQQHDDFLADAIETAKHRISICIPFVTKDPEFLEDIFPIASIAAFLKSNKILQIFYRANDENIDGLFQHFSKIKSPNLVLKRVDGLHRKTLIVDDVYVEGSFNWLSSARTLRDDYCLMETSFVIQGSSAGAYIDKFYRSFSGF